MYPHYLVKPVMTRAAIELFQKNLQNLSHLNCGFQMRHMWKIVLLQNTHHRFGRSERATDNGVGQAGLRCHCDSHSLVASSTISACVNSMPLVYILSTVS